MQDVNVVIVFDSRDESIERLALAAAVGAVQGRAFIRLRRFPGTPDHREYVTPRDADAEWADAFLVASQSVPPEAETWLAALRRRTSLLVAEIDTGSVDTATQQGRSVAEKARAARPK